jgi:DNA replication protein DnaC
MLCQFLRNIPQSKLKFLLNSLDKIKDENKRERAQNIFIRYFEANIPLLYWRLEMNKDFEGDQSLFDTYESIVNDLQQTFINGKSLCFAGAFGRGKTMTCCNILKRAVEKGYSALYTTLTDIVSATFSEESYLARRELMLVDFLVIDEFDSRHIASSNKSIDFFGRVLEDVIRVRSNNNLPLFFCTNSPNPLEPFQDSIKASISSLWNNVEMIPVLGKDYRVIGVKK